MLYYLKNKFNSYVNYLNSDIDNKDFYEKFDRWFYTYINID